MEAAGLVPELQAPAYVLHACRLGPESPEGAVRFGVTSESLWYARPPSLAKASGGAAASKAGAKLAEALCVARCLGLWDAEASRGSGRFAVDVGAAPGSWTAVLAGLPSMRRVFAVDPAEMAPGVLGLRPVRHIPRSAAEAPPAISAELAGLGAAQIDVLVCDVNAHGRDALALLTPLLPLLRPGGLLVWTLKCRGKGRMRDGLEAELMEAISPWTEEFGES